MFAKFIKLTFSLFAVTVLWVPFSANAQNYPDNPDSLIFESLNDSIDIVSNFYDFTDSLAFLFSKDSSEVDYEDILMEHPSDSVYLSWDNENTHYPKIDFSNKADTTILILADNIKHFFVNPFDGQVTSQFGMRRYRYHYGTDINLATGDSVRCAFDGKIRITKRSRSYGYVIVVRHPNGLETLYAHLSKILVDTNQEVRAGDVIALGGNTGRSRGSHLHFEIRYLGSPINPEQIVNFQQRKLISDTLYLTKEYFNYRKSIQSLKNAKYYKVKSGDTLSGIAAKFRTSVANLRKINRLTKKSVIRAGRRLRVS
ncbi:MAG: M23 family metallopeptidase [Bacteroidota bacterium]